MKSITKTARAWCWTLNNYTSEEVEAIGQSTLRYIIFGYETGKEGTPHLQGYLESDKPLSMAAIKKMPGLYRAHLAIREGTREEARDYCLKGDQTKDEWNALKTEGPNWGLNAKTFERGDWSAGGQGRRNDKKCSSAPNYQEWYDSLYENPNLHDFASNYPEAAFRYPSGVRMVIDSIKQRHLKEKAEEIYKDFKPTKWQAFLLENLEKKPNPRKVIWYVDETGNRGKTYIANYLLSKGNATYFTGGRTADIAHQYDGERIVLFDFCRSLDDKVNYQAIESLKNGLIQSPKYDSKLKQFEIPHVVCFSNFHPDISKLSKDRWDIRHLNDKEHEIKEQTDVQEVPDMSIAEALKLASYIDVEPLYNTTQTPSTTPSTTPLETPCKKDIFPSSQEPEETSDKSSEELTNSYPLNKSQLTPEDWNLGGQDNCSPIWPYKDNIETDSCSESTESSEESREGVILTPRYQKDSSNNSSIPLQTPSISKSKSLPILYRTINGRIIKNPRVKCSLSTKID